MRAAFWFRSRPPDCSAPSPRCGTGGLKWLAALDADSGAVEPDYRRVVRDSGSRLLPRVMDPAAPGPAVGWNLRERLSLVERRPADTVLALTLVHHIPIGPNLPLGEFVPKDDPMARRLLAARAAVLDDYHCDGFESFGRWFRICERYPIPRTGRTLYLLHRQAA